LAKSQSSTQRKTNIRGDGLNGRCMEQTKNHMDKLQQRQKQKDDIK